ncbi:MAG: hypothetical protein QW842_02330 [Candidatus Nezhaarchaeales archaeon]
MALELALEPFKAPRGEVVKNKRKTILYHKLEYYRILHANYIRGEGSLKTLLLYGLFLVWKFYIKCLNLIKKY